MRPAASGVKAPFSWLVCFSWFIMAVFVHAAWVPDLLYSFSFLYIPGLFLFFSNVNNC